MPQGCQLMSVDSQSVCQSVSDRDRYGHQKKKGKEEKYKQINAAHSCGLLFEFLASSLGMRSCLGLLAEG